MEKTNETVVIVANTDAANTQVATTERKRKSKEYRLVAQSKAGAPITAKLEAPNFMVAAEKFAQDYGSEIADLKAAKVEMTDAQGKTWNDSVQKLLNQLERQRNPGAPRKTKAPRPDSMKVWTEGAPAQAAKAPEAPKVAPVQKPEDAPVSVAVAYGHAKTVSKEELIEVAKKAAAAVNAKKSKK